MTVSLPLHHQLKQSKQLCELINQFNPLIHTSYRLHEVIAVLHVLEERIELAIHQTTVKSSSQSQVKHLSSSKLIQDTIDFFSQPTIPASQIKLSKTSLTH
jgi:hypothetical protein